MKVIFFVMLAMLSQELMAGDGKRVYLGANLSIDDKVVVWPIISLPGEKVLVSADSVCFPPRHKIDCVAPVQKTAAALGMDGENTKWFDAKGESHFAQSGYHNENPVGGAGDGLNGFIIGLRKHSDPSSDGGARYLGAITSAPGLIAQKTERRLEEGDKSDVERVLASWRRKYFRECGEYCAKGVNQLAHIKALKLQVTEYRLPGGRIFLHFKGRSIREVRREATPQVGADVLYLIVDFWKYADAEEYVGEGRVESTGCETQCGAGWWGSPDVMGYGNTLYILGERSGGTTYGYYLFRLRHNALKLVASLTGGS